jgi:hypothetical protein
MKKVYICAPLKAHGPYTIDENIRYAKGYSNWVYTFGHLPICPHIYLEPATGLKEESDREKLLELGIELLKLCDELWVFGDYISEGMKHEIEMATELGIKVKLWREKR